MLEHAITDTIKLGGNAALEFVTGNGRFPDLHQPICTKNLVIRKLCIGSLGGSSFTCFPASLKKIYYCGVPMDAVEYFLDYFYLHEQQLGHLELR